MKKLETISIGNAILWGAAIISSAIVKAPPFFTLIILPSLFFSSMLLMYPTIKKCKKSGEDSI